MRIKAGSMVRTYDGRMGEVIRLRKGVEYPCAVVQFEDGSTCDFECHDLVVVI